MSHPTNQSDKLTQNQQAESGQGLVEYALILVFVAVVAVVIVTVLGPGIQKFYTNMVGILRSPSQLSYTTTDLQNKINACVTDTTAKSTLTTYVSSHNISSLIDYTFQQTSKGIEAGCAADIVQIANHVT